MRQTYSVRESAELLGIGLNTAYEAVRSGDIPSIKVGGRYLVLKQPLDERLGVRRDPVGHETARAA